MNARSAFIVLLVFMLLASCGQRLGPVLYQIRGEARQGLIPESSYSRDGFTLTDTYDANPLRPGRGKILVTNQIATDIDRADINIGLIKAVGEICYRIYVILPEEIVKDSLGIADRSICRIIGMYELADSLRHYVCRDGYLKIDTVKSSRFHAWFSGSYYNVNNDSLIFNGDLNVKRKR